MKKSKPEVPFPAFPDLITAIPSSAAAQSHSQSQPQDAPEESNSPEQAKEKYWEKKLQELTLENIKLQEKLAEATKSRDRFLSQQLEPAKAAAAAAEAALAAEAAKAKQLQEELQATRQNRDQLSARLLEDQGEMQRLKQVNEELS